MASGCLGLVTFPREPGRVTLERIEEICPRLVPTLAGHPGIGFVLVRSEHDGAVVIGARGVHFLDRDAWWATTRSRRSGRTPPHHVRRTDGFPHCPDILVNSTYWAESDEVAAFEELVGSHGGGRRPVAPVRAVPVASSRYPETPSSAPSDAPGDARLARRRWGRTPTGRSKSPVRGP